MKKRENESGFTILTNSGLGSAAEEDRMVASPEKERAPQTLMVDGGVGGGGCGGMYGSGRGSGDVSGYGLQNPGPWPGPGSTDAYYEMMIQANPGNLLLLANYAKFLKEIKGDFATAGEYCGRQFWQTQVMAMCYHFMLI